MVLVTVCCANFTAKAIHLAQSIRQAGIAATIVVCFLERPGVDSGPLPDVFDNCLYAADLPYNDFDQFVFRHTLVEAATAIKARLLIRLAEVYQEEEHFVYLDPDIWVFSDFQELYRVYESSDVIVTPHHLEDETTYEATRDNVFRTLRCGIFNLGFLAVKRTAQGMAFLRWWDERLSTLCYIDFDRGLYVDQRWVDLAASFFDITVLREPGYNVANWNISRRPITRSNGEYRAAGKPLRFMHFSGTDSGRDLRFFLKYCPPGTSAVDLRAAYIESLAQCGQLSFACREWSYDFYDSGQRINSLARSAYRNRAVRETCPRPYESSNEVIITAGGC